jgi:hypothetical protein
MKIRCGKFDRYARDTVQKLSALRTGQTKHPELLCLVCVWFTSHFSYGFTFTWCEMLCIDTLNPRSPRSHAIADRVQPQTLRSRRSHAIADPTQPQQKSSPSCATPSSCDRCHAEHHPGQRSAARRRCDSLWGGADSFCRSPRRSARRRSRDGVCVRKTRARAWRSCFPLWLSQ